MDVIHIEAKDDTDISLPENAVSQLPANVGLITTIQYLHKLEELRSQLPAAVIGGQVLGCDTSAAQNVYESVDAYLYVGSGRFHPLAVRMDTGKPVYTYNPFTEEFDTVPDDEVESARKRRKGAVMKFLSAQKIGILVSTKHGQCKLDDAVAFSRRTQKETFLLLADEITPGIPDSFPFIECFVNTACPRIAEDNFSKPIVNLSDIREES